MTKTLVESVVRNKVWLLGLVMLGGCSALPNASVHTPSKIYFSHSDPMIKQIPDNDVQKITLPIIYFANNSYEVTPTEREKLKQFVMRFKANHPPIFIYGHTDWNQNEQYNDFLSQRRSDSVLSVLVDLGYPTKKMTPLSLGESQPVANNQTEQGRQLNRRVTLSLF